MPLVVQYVRNSNFYTDWLVLVECFFLRKKVSPFWQLWLEQIRPPETEPNELDYSFFFCKTSHLYKVELKFFVRIGRSCFDICEWDL